MTPLTFRTPSRRCPLRPMNGCKAVILQHLGHKKTRRAGIVPVFEVKLDWSHWPNNPRFGIAYGDELFIEPEGEAWKR